MLKLTFYGHACFLLESPQGRVLVDPWFPNNPHTDADPESIRCDFIALTHGHFDHCEDAETIAKNNDAAIIAMSELCMYYEKLGCKTVRMNIGGGREFPFGRLKMTPAWHSSSIPAPDEPAYAGLAAGFVFTMGGARIYHAGDTGFFQDMTHIGKGGIDVALLPIGDSVVMGFDDAIEAVRVITPKLVVPMHYNSFPAIMQDPHAFAEQVHGETKARCVVLTPGEPFDVQPS